MVGTYYGPVWYDTEENLLIPFAEPARGTIHRKGPFTTWNLRGRYELGSGLWLTGAVRNLLNKNDDPLFIAIQQGAPVQQRGAVERRPRQQHAGARIHRGLRVADVTPSSWHYAGKIAMRRRAAGYEETPLPFHPSGCPPPAGMANLTESCSPRTSGVSAG